MTSKTLLDYQRIIAEATVPCISCAGVGAFADTSDLITLGGGPPSPCSPCTGTGRVLRYSWASKLCGYCSGEGSKVERKVRYVCHPCKQTGRIPTVDPLRVAEELASQNWWVELWLGDSTGFRVVVRRLIWEPETTVNADGPDLATALCAALVEAEGLKRNE